MVKNFASILNLFVHLNQKMNLKVGGDVPFNGDGDIILGLQPKHQNQVQS